jgi:divalent metal cation (Fe/Co/Zn/Cd) transporter
VRDCHEVTVLRVEDKILVSCHCTMDGSLPIGQVHDITAKMETRLKQAFPQLFRVTIHPEPPEEN